MAYLLHQLLTASAERHPDKEAVTFENRSITYRELEAASDQLAHALIQHGVGKGDRVGICLNKCMESVISIFGILKAGAVYVPLDAAAPPKRLAFIVGNCGMKALVGASKKIAGITHLLPDSRSAPRLVLTDDASWREMLRSPADPPRAPVIEQDLAYILYTSGSTGEPKGVMISHRTSLTFVNWAYETFGVQPADRVSNHAPLHFDLSIFDIFTTIQAGGTVVLVPEQLSVFPMDLARFIEQQCISIWYSVPSVLTRLVLHGDLGRHRFATLRTILFAGEVFPAKYLRALRALIPHARYCNLYGPTETNVCTWYEVKDLREDSDQPIPIGKPCANTEVFVVNDRQEIARPGEEGELYVRGPCVMNGYWGLQERTRDVLVRFPLPPPFEEQVVYRTGDIVKQDENGNFLFLGRRDHMIKSRGYRIELGEIESALYSHPNVVEAAVIAVPDEEIGNAIKAVVVTRQPNGLTAAELEYHCAQRIPKYMIPGTIEFRSSLPKTSTGKIDRTSLRSDHPAPLVGAGAGISHA